MFAKRKKIKPLSRTRLQRIGTRGRNWFDYEKNRSEITSVLTGRENEVSIFHRILSVSFSQHDYSFFSLDFHCARQYIQVPMIYIHIRLYT